MEKKKPVKKSASSLEVAQEHKETPVEVLPSAIPMGKAPAPLPMATAYLKGRKPTRRTDKVAIVGFAPSSLHQAPWLDESWEIWTLNNIYTAFALPRWDRWFELHKNFREYPPMHDARVDAGSVVRGDARQATGNTLHHVDWLKQQAPDKPIYFLKDEPDIPAAVKFPFDEFQAWCEKQGHRVYFSNSISYMIALALMDGYTTVGVWGVDMAAGGEYQVERPSVEYWLALVEKYGKLVLPKETELLKSRLYGFQDDNEFATKTKVRIGELSANEANATNQMRQAEAAMHYFRGAKEDAQYFLNNWGNGA